MSRIVFAGALFLLCSTFAHAAGPWCASNCTSLCQQSAQDTGMTVDFCVSKYQCSKYPTAPCASAEVMAQRLGRIRASRGGGSGR
jgi:hypothetical protein